jgi:hypothetical protein
MPALDRPFHSVAWKVNTRCNDRCSWLSQPSFDGPYPRIEHQRELTTACRPPAIRRSSERDPWRC